MTKRSTARQQMLSDIVVTAVEGGIEYWAVVSDYEWQDDMNASATVREVLDWDAGEYGEPMKIDPDVMARGLRRVLNGAVHPESYTYRYASEGDRHPDDHDIDAWVADDIVQAALFGEVRYG